MAGRSYKRTSRGTRITKRGVRVTASQYKKIRYYVQQANKIRERELKKASAGRRADYEIEKSKQGDFILSYKKVDLQRFRNQEHFDEYFRRLHLIVSGSYQRHINSVYKDNLIRSLRTKFKSGADTLIKDINKLTPQELRDITLADELHDIGWIYGEQIKEDQRFTAIRNQIKDIIKRRGK